MAAIVGQRCLKCGQGYYNEAAGISGRWRSGPRSWRCGWRLFGSRSRRGRDREVDTLRSSRADDGTRRSQDLRWKDEHALGLQQQVDEPSLSLLQVMAKHKEHVATLETRGQQVVALKEELVAARHAEPDHETDTADVHGALERHHEALRVAASRLKRELRCLC